MTLTLMSLSCSDLIECLPWSYRPVSGVKGKSFTNWNIWSLRSLFGNIASLCLLHLQVNCAPKLGRTLQPARGSRPYECILWIIRKRLLWSAQLSLQIMFIYAYCTCFLCWVDLLYTCIPIRLQAVKWECLLFCHWTMIKIMVVHLKHFNWMKI